MSKSFHFTDGESGLEEVNGWSKVIDQVSSIWLKSGSIISGSPPRSSEGLPVPGPKPHSKLGNTVHSACLKSGARESSPRAGAGTDWAERAGAAAADKGAARSRAAALSGSALGKWLPPASSFFSRQPAPLGVPRAPEEPERKEEMTLPRSLCSPHYTFKKNS